MHSKCTKGVLLKIAFAAIIAQSCAIPYSPWENEFRPDSHGAADVPYSPWEKEFFNEAHVAEADCLREFEQFRSKHEKVYSAEQLKERMTIFCENRKEIAKINSAGKSWTAGINEYSDLTWEEFKAMFTMKTTQNCSATTQTPLSKYVPLGVAPKEMDWRNATCGETSCVSMVKNQGKCGSCWTFSTVAALESAHAIKTGMMILLSEQQLVDCAGDYGNNGCNGGLPSQAFEYARASGGLSRMDDYPYACGDGHCAPTAGPCRFDASLMEVGATVKAVVNFTAGDEDGMRLVVGLHQPVSVAFEVVSDLRHYSTGVYSSPTCNSTSDSVNHAVLAVGYGAENGVNYWTIKNSWGFGWGNNGYFKMQRDANMCGVAQCSSFPVVPFS